jgi:hypothetical protein
MALSATNSTGGNGMAIYKTRWFDRWAGKQGIGAQQGIAQAQQAHELIEVNRDAQDEISDS